MYTANQHNPSTLRCYTTIATIILAMFGVVCAPIPLSAQSTAWNWYFGQHASLSFKTGTPIPTLPSEIFTGEGCASYSNPKNGDLILYTDGVTVWNKNHNIIQNGTGLAGDPSTSQSALILPSPDVAGVYYIFNAAPVTSSDIGQRCLCLVYSVVDFRVNTDGAVTTKNEVLFNGITEHLTATADCSGSGWWVVVRSGISRHFYSFRIASGIPVKSPPVQSDASNPNFTINDAGQLHISPNGKRLIITSVTGGAQLYEFNTVTGKVFNGLDLFTSNATIKQCYGAAFSQSSNMVYIAYSRENPGSATRIYQFNTVTGSTSAAILASKTLIAEMENVYAWVPMQLAPDSKIYIGRPHEARLDCINFPTELGSSCFYVDSAVALLGNCSTGLPNVVGSDLLPKGSIKPTCNVPKAHFLSQTICAGQTANFTDSSTGDISTWEWQFQGGIPASSYSRNPRQISYRSSGTFSVRLIVRNSLGADTTFGSIVVNPALSLQVDAVAPICFGDTISLYARGAKEYSWFQDPTLSNTSGPTPKASPQKPTTYTVYGVNEYGCADTATVFVDIVSASAGSDQTICPGGSAELNTIGAESVVWSPATGLSSSTSLNPTASPTVTTKYTATLRVGNCTIIDEVTVFVVDSFSVSIQGANTACIGDTIVVIATGGTNISWSGATILSAIDHQATVLITQPLTNLVVRASSSTCVAFDTLVILAATKPTLRMPAPKTICRGDNVVLTATSSDGAITWQPHPTLTLINESTATVNPTTTTTYYATCTLSQGCSVTDSVTIVVAQQLLVEAGPDKEICFGSSVQLSATGSATSYNWLPVTGLNNPNTLAPIASPTQSTLYTLTAQSGECVITDSVWVRVEKTAVNLPDSVSICNGESVELLATGAARFKWEPATGLSDPNIANPVASPNRTTVYTVTGTDPLDCEAQSTITVFVKDTLPFVLRLGNITASVGKDNTTLPVYVDTPSDKLPLLIPKLLVTIIVESSGFAPNSGANYTVSDNPENPDNEKIIRIRLENVPVFTSTQKLLDIKGLVYLSKSQKSIARFDTVEWVGLSCPSTTSYPGVITIIGCGIELRPFVIFGNERLALHTDFARNAITITREGGIPGLAEVQILSYTGQTTSRATFPDILTTDQPQTLVEIPMEHAQSGLFFARIHTPTAVHTIPFVWMR